MNTNKQIMLCLGVTALIASLILSSLLPDLITALLLIGGGCMAAYYMALSTKRYEIINQMSAMVRAEQNLQSSTSLSMAVKSLKEDVSKLTGADEVYFFCHSPTCQDNVTEPDSSILDEKFVAAVISRALESRGTFIGTDKEDNEWHSFITPLNIKEFMAVPVQAKGQLMGVLFIGVGSRGGLDHKQKLAEGLALYAAKVIFMLTMEDEKHSQDMLIIKAMVNAIDNQQPYFSGHSHRVTMAAGLIGRKLHLTSEETSYLEYSALLHDIGKITTNTDSDGEELPGRMEHPVSGAAMLPEGDFFKPIKEAVLNHHERYDGQGYPQGLMRNEIPFLARIIAVADVYDALVCLCSPEERVNHARAVQTIKKATGTMFDPLVVVAFEEAEAEISSLYSRCNDRAASG